MATLESSARIEKMEPYSHGRTDLRKRKPKLLAIINENCTGCAGSPVCTDYCPVEACMFWVPNDDGPFGRIEVDKALCIGCAKCTSKGPDGLLLLGCPWDAIDMVNIEDWESERGVQLPAAPDREPNDWGFVPREFV